MIDNKIATLMCLLDASDHAATCGKDKGYRLTRNDDPCPKCIWNKLKKGKLTPKYQRQLKVILEQTITFAP